MAWFERIGSAALLSFWPLQCVRLIRQGLEAGFGVGVLVLAVVDLVLSGSQMS